MGKYIPRFYVDLITYLCPNPKLGIATLSGKKRSLELVNNVHLAHWSWLKVGPESDYMCLWYGADFTNIAYPKHNWVNGIDT